MTDHNTEKRQSWLKTLHPKTIGWDVLATALGTIALLIALFI